MKEVFMKFKEIICLIFIGLMAMKADAFAFEYEYNLYETADGQMSQSYLDLIDQSSNENIKKILYKAFEMSQENIGYSFDSSFENYLSGESNVLSCSQFIYELFRRSGLELNYLSSSDFVRAKAIDLKNNFIILKNKNANHKFKPQTGDVMAYQGHVVMVIDPKNCVAINSTSWTMDPKTNRRLNDKKGVFFQKIGSSRCSKGVWKAWDSSSNKFEVLLRHKSFVNWQDLD